MTAPHPHRRIFQVEIHPDEEEPEFCVVSIINPRNGDVVATLEEQDTEPWLAE